MSIADGRPPQASGSGGVRLGASSEGALVHAVALALHLDELGVGEEAIEDGGGGGDVAEEDAPVLRGSV